MSHLKVGDRAVNVNATSRHFGAQGKVVEVTDHYVSIDRDDGVRGSGIGGSWTARHSGWARLDDVQQAVTEPEPVQPVEDWSYAEAERLYQAAVEAMSVYNQYIERKPTVNYLQGSTPTKW